MSDYNYLKKNPDPVIVKVTQEKAPMPKEKTELNTPDKVIELPKTKEIPEVRNTEPAMEIL